MARSYPAQSMGQVAIKLYKVTEMKGGGTMKTHYSWTLKQADREGAIRLDNDGKIVEIVNPSVKIELPDTLQPEDVFHIDLLNAAKDAE